MTTALLAPGVPRDVDPFVSVFTDALQGSPCVLIGLGESPIPLPMAQWGSSADASDRAVLAHCRGRTIDVGCGPGRMAAHLLEQGHVVLGLDVVPEAVEQTRHRGVSAVLGDVFGQVPAEGSWDTALLADGNVGIGGDPVRLLGRVRGLLTPQGRVVVDLAEYGAGMRHARVRLSSALRTSGEFPWAVVGADAIASVADAAGFARTELHEYAGRWFAVVERA